MTIAPYFLQTMNNFCCLMQKHTGSCMRFSFSFSFSCQNIELVQLSLSSKLLVVFYELIIGSGRGDVWHFAQHSYVLSCMHSFIHPHWSISILLSLWSSLLDHLFGLIALLHLLDQFNYEFMGVHFMKMTIINMNINDLYQFEIITQIRFLSAIWLNVFGRIM